MPEKMKMGHFGNISIQITPKRTTKSPIQVLAHDSRRINNFGIKMQKVHALRNYSSVHLSLITDQRL